MLSALPRTLVAILLLGFIFTSSREVRVPAKCRMKNRGSGICWYCAAETGCRALGHKAGWGICERHAEDEDGAHVGLVGSELKSLGIPCEVRWWTDLAWVKQHTDAGEPVCVSFWFWSHLNAHAVLVTHVSRKWVYFVDSNYPEDTYRWGIEDFTAAWMHNGCAILVD